MPGLLDDVRARSGGDPARVPDAVLDALTAWAGERGQELYPAQTEALLAVLAGDHLVLSTPTGSGKSLVALGAHLAALATGQRSAYTAPVKALVGEKFFALVDLLGADAVGLSTGDATVNPTAPLVCCTAEVLATAALRGGADTPFDQVVMDEFHYYGDPERGWAWLVPLLEMPRAQMVLMSATLGDVRRLTDDLRTRTGRDVSEVTGTERPVPLRYDYALTPVHETLAELVSTHQSPVYVVHTTQEAAAERASALMSVPLASREQRDAIGALLEGTRMTTRFGQTLSRLLRHGVGVHHAGMLPRYRRLVERLAQAGLLAVVCGTDTLGVGVNLPIRTVLFTALTKYDGTTTRHLRAREFHQVAGRAGRAGFDTSGLVVAEAPEHVIENTRRLAKVGDDPKKRRSVRRVTPPQGFVSWDDKTFTRLQGAAPETLQPRLRITHAVVLALLERPADVRASLRDLVERAPLTPEAQGGLLAHGEDLLASLVASGVVEELAEPDARGRTLVVTERLQRGFALAQPLSAFAVAALELLDRDAPTYSLDVVSAVEATLDDPRPVLQAQRREARAVVVAEAKAQGVEYEERVELVADVTWPRPLAELLEGALLSYAAGQPWVTDEVLSPKSVVREMAESGWGFSDVISAHALGRSEGVVLRYLAEAYRALSRTVPEPAKTEELHDLVAWLGEMVRQVDSSLIDEWETLRADAAAGGLEPGAAPPEARGEVPPVTRNARAFRVLVRNALWHRVELASRRQWVVLGDLDGEAGWDAQRWESALAPYWAEHAQIGTGADARGPALHQVDEGPEGGPPRTWRVRQVLADPAGDHDRAVVAEVDLAASDAAGEAVVRVVDVGRLGDW